MDAAENQPARTLPRRARRFPAVWIFAVVLLAALLFVGFFATQEKMPSHAGRSAEAWLREIFGPQRLASANPHAVQREAIDAFRHMDTDGISFLVESLEREDSAWNRIALKLHPKLPAVLRTRVPEPVRADILAGAASLVLTNVADPHPEQTFPRLVEMLESPNSLTRWHARSVVSHYATHYRTLNLELNELQRHHGLADTNYWIRLRAVVTLRDANLAGLEIVPLLNPARTNGDPTLSNAAQSAIRRLEKLPPREP